MGPVTLAQVEKVLQESRHNSCERVRSLYEQLTDPPITVPGRARVYTLLRLLAAGDIADVHLATSDYDPQTTAEPFFVLKVSRVPEGHVLVDNERAALTALLAEAGETSYRKYLPSLTESFSVRDGFHKRINVFLHEPGLYTLEQVHGRQPALDAEHLLWVFKRLLTVLGFSHRLGIVHGAVLPWHVLIDPATHGLRLVGWGQSVETGRPVQTISTRYRAWYPAEVFRKGAASAATDLFLAARCLVYLAGGDPTADGTASAVPQPLRQIVRSCLLEGPGMRPHDAWAALDDLERLSGPATFHPLTLI